jgi:sugar phosphate isomerase/epimerase
MKLGLNSVLFGGHTIDAAFHHAQMCGYDGIELSAIDGMSEHLVLDRWREVVPKVRELSSRYELPLLAMEQPSQDEGKMESAFQAAAELSIPIINCGPGGKANDESTFQLVVDSLGTLAERATHYGVTLCFKAHVGQYVYNTATTLKVLGAVNHPNLGLDMDPSHIWRAGENPVEAIAAVARQIRHVHIRDCKGRQQNPGPPELQANGRGDVDLLGYLRVLHASGYAGPVDLEVIGAKEYDLARCIAIAAEARGHMQACLQACGAR